MIVANVKIHYGAYSKRYYTYWSQDVSGGCFRTIIPSGNWCTITSESGPKKVESNICSTNLYER